MLQSIIALIDELLTDTDSFKKLAIVICLLLAIVLSIASCAMIYIVYLERVLILQEIFKECVEIQG